MQAVLLASKFNPKPFILSECLSDYHCVSHKIQLGLSLVRRKIIHVFDDAPNAAGDVLLTLIALVETKLIITTEITMEALTNAKMKITEEHLLRYGLEPPAFDHTPCNLFPIDPDQALFPSSPPQNTAFTSPIQSCRKSASANMTCSSVSISLLGSPCVNAMNETTKPVAVVVVPTLDWLLGGPA
jgi:hypothetical protein